MKKYTSHGIDDLEWGRLRDATPGKTLERFILPSASGDVKKPLLALGRRISLSARPRKQKVWLRVLQSLRLLIAILTYASLERVRLSVFVKVLAKLPVNTKFRVDKNGN